MSHGIQEFDGFAYVGSRPWHGLGQKFDGEGCMTSEDALRIAKLNWQVIPTPIYTEGAVTAASLPGAKVHPIEGFVANVREDTNEVLGVVTDKYRIAQNADAFKFADDLMGLTKEDGARYETAGSLWNGRRVFMLINLPEEKILDDSVERYLCLANSHDGSSALKVFCTATRVVCNNTLNMALRNAGRGISIRHMSSMDQRKSEAVRTLGVASRYFDELRKFAEYLSGKKVNADDLLKKLYPEDPKWTLRQKKSNEDLKGVVLDIYNGKPDLANFRGTAWGFVQAIADHQSNTPPRRKTSTFASHRMESFIDGDYMLNEATKLVLEVVA
jgi:phage/plasmid-like protein (TIGR03299 family)